MLVFDERPDKTVAQSHRSVELKLLPYAAKCYLFQVLTLQARMEYPKPNTNNTFTQSIGPDEMAHITKTYVVVLMIRRAS